MMGKTIIYQILPRLWGNDSQSPVKNGSLFENGSGRFSDIDAATLKYLKGLGVTHLWLTGVIRHSSGVSFNGCRKSNPQIVKGKAGSPYAITDYYDVNPYLADNPSERMKEFESLIARIHENGLKALIDFVPNHVSRDYGKAGMAREDVKPLGFEDDNSLHWKPENDFFYYPGQTLILPSPVGEGLDPYYENPAKASGNCFSPAPSISDWYETVRLNYCDFHTKTWDKMLDIVNWWCGKGVDGFRCDMIEMVPREFFKWMIVNVKENHPDVIFIGEAYGKAGYSAFLNEVGFDLLYDKSGQYDTVRSIVENRGSAKGLTWNWQSLGDAQPKMLNFLENHDEQRFASSFFGGDVRRSYAALCSSLFFNTSAFMLYFGEEVGERGMDEEGFSGLDGRTSIYDWWSVGSVRRLREHIHKGKGLLENESAALERHSKALNMAASLPAVYQGSSFDLCYCNYSSPGFDPDKHFAFLRCKDAELYLFVCNFSDADSVILIAIPPEACSCLSFKGNKNLNPESRIEVKVLKHDCAVLKLS